MTRQARIGEKRDERLKGILCLCAGIALFSIQDVIIKLMSGEYPISEAMTIRSLTALPLLTGLVYLNGGLATLRSPHMTQLITRGVLNLIAYTGYYLGLAALPMASCVALFFTAPLFIVALSVPVLGERVGYRRWTAVIVGFLGVILMMRPGSDLFDWAALLPAGAASAYAFAQIIARRLGEREGAAVMTFYSNALFLSGGLLLAVLFGPGEYGGVGHKSLDFLLRGWAVPTSVDLLSMALCGVIAAAALPLLTQAYRIAQANVVAPFEYTAMIWGVLYGWLVFDQLPQSWTWMGIALIGGAGIFVLSRERRSPSTHV